MLIILPVLWNLSLEIIGTLKLVLGNHYTGSRFCYWYLLWSSTFGYWILIRIGDLAKSVFLFGNILYMTSYGTIYSIITGSSYIQVGQARLSNGIFWCLRSSLLLCMLLGRVLLISGKIVDTLKIPAYAGLMITLRVALIIFDLL